MFRARIPCYSIPFHARISYRADDERPPPDSVIRGEPERFIPEKIIKQRTRKGKLQYLVKWYRYPENRATWEPANQLEEDAPNLVDSWKVS